MKRKIVAVAGTAALLVGVLVTRPAGAAGDTARALLLNGSGQAVGRVAFATRGGQTTVGFVGRNLPAGIHGFHVHSVGTCAAPSFASAGGHFNPGGGSHPVHAGDMPVMLVNANGTGGGSFLTTRFVVNDLFDADGSAVIVHAGPDNYANIPTRYAAAGPDAATLATGDAGTRHACGVITRSQ